MGEPGERSKAWAVLEDFDNDMFPCTMFKWNELMMHDSTLQCAILGIMDNKHGHPK